MLFQMSCFLFFRERTKMLFQQKMTGESCYRSTAELSLMANSSFFSLQWREGNCERSHFSTIAGRFNFFRKKISKPHMIFTSDASVNNSKISTNYFHVLAYDKR